MNIAVIGTGNVGGRLATRWHELGHHVVAGRRDPSSPARHLAPSVPSAPPAEAVTGAEVVVLALPSDAAPAVIATLDLDGRIVVDTMNAVGRPPPGQHPTMFAAVRAALVSSSPRAAAVKAFNSLGAEAITDPAAYGAPAFLPVASDDAAAAAVVVRLAAELGLDAVHLGDAERAADLEALARVWLALAFGPPALGRRLTLALLRP